MAIKYEFYMVFCSVVLGLTSCADPGFSIDYHVLNNSNNEIIVELYEGKNQREWVTIKPFELGLIYSRHQLGEYSEDDKLEYAMENLEIQSIWQGMKQTTKPFKNINEWINVSNEDMDFIELHLIIEDKDF